MKSNNNLIWQAKFHEEKVSSDFARSNLKKMEDYLCAANRAAQ